jgi:membrane protein YdbS with pleckstrin-like domain
VSASATAGAGTRAAEWVYRGLWRVLAGWFRVPAEAPTLPARRGESAESFKPDLAFVRYLKLWFWIVLAIIDLAILAGWIAITVVSWPVGLALAPVALVVAVVPDVIAYVAIHLRYDTTWYVMTDRSLRIRRGVWIIQEMTITYQNVQNMRITQGPVERHFGIARLTVETAGASADPHQGRGGIGNRAMIEGVRDPQRLRERILDRLKRSRGAGLGDLDDERARGGGAWTAEHVAVLREIRDELAALVE